VTLNNEQPVKATSTTVLVPSENLSRSKTC